MTDIPKIEGNAFSGLLTPVKEGSLKKIPHKIEVKSEKGSKIYEYTLHERVIQLSHQEQKKSHKTALLALIFTLGTAWIIPNVRALWKEGQTGQRKDLVYVKGAESKASQIFGDVHGTSSKSSTVSSATTPPPTLRTPPKTDEDTGKKTVDKKDVELSEEDKRAQHQKNIDEYKEKVGFTGRNPRVLDLEPNSKEGQIQDHIIFGFNPEAEIEDYKPWGKLDLEGQKEFYKDAVSIGLKDKIDYNIKSWEIGILEKPENIGVKYPNYSKSETSFFEKIKGDEEFIKGLKEPEKKEKAPAAPAPKKKSENIEDEKTLAKEEGVSGESLERSAQIKAIVDEVNENGVEKIIEGVKSRLKGKKMTGNQASQVVKRELNTNNLKEHLRNYVDSLTKDKDQSFRDEVYKQTDQLVSTAKKKEGLNPKALRLSITKNKT